MYFQVFIQIQIYCCFSGSTTYKIYLHIYISHKLYSIYHGIFATILILPPIVILKVIEYPATPTKKPEYQLKLYVCLQVLISLRVKILFLFAHPFAQSFQSNPFSNFTFYFEIQTYGKINVNDSNQQNSIGCGKIKVSW